jgi:hypothetical protein
MSTTDRDLVKLLGDSWKGIEEGLPACNLVQFNENLYQVSSAMCEAIWSRDLRKCKIVGGYVEEKIKILKSLEPSCSKERIARGIVARDLDVLFRIFVQASSKYCDRSQNPLNPGNHGNPGNPFEHKYVDKLIVNMILSRDTAKACKFEEELANMTVDAYRDRKTEKFRELCAYSNALIYFRKAVSRMSMS